MNQRNSNIIIQEQDLLFKIASMSSTTKEFLSMKNFVDSPARRLSSLIDRLQTHGSYDVGLTKHSYILNLGKEIIQHFSSREYKLEEMQDLLFQLYLTSMGSYFSLVDRFELEDKFGEKFPNRAQAILWGWTLKGEKLGEDSSSAMIEKIKEYYRQRGIKCYGL